MATDTPVLNLTTTVEKLHVRIDGVPHYFKGPDALTLVQHLRMEKISPRIAELLKVAEAGTIAADAEQDLHALLDEACRMVVEASEAVHARLTDVHRTAIVWAFLTLQLEGRTTGATPTATNPTVRRRSGARSSRVSSGSTGARRKAG